MCEIVICEKSNVLKLLKQEKYDAIISICNPSNHQQDHKSWIKKLAKKCEELLCLYFDDTLTSKNDGPRIEHIRKIMSFAKDLRDKKVLIHCSMGVSRSTATAMIVLNVLGIDMKEAESYVKKIRKIADPNPFMLEMYDDIVNNKISRRQSSKYVEVPDPGYLSSSHESVSHESNSRESN